MPSPTRRHHLPFLFLAPPLTLSPTHSSFLTTTKSSSSSSFHPRKRSPTTIQTSPRLPFPPHPPTATLAPPSPPPSSSPTNHQKNIPPSIQPPNSPSNHLWPRALLLLVAAIWGTNFPTVKLLQSGIHPVPLSTAAFARFALSAAFLAPFAYRGTKSINSPKTHPTSACLTDSLAIGLALTFGYFTQSISLLTTEANKSAFICSLAVVLVPLLERAPSLLGRRPHLHRNQSPLVTWGAPLLAVLGVAMLELGGASNPSQGDMWALLQALAFALGFIGNERAAAKYPGFLPFITFVQLATVAAFSAIWSCIDASIAAHTLSLPDLSPVFASPANVTAVVYAGIVTTALTVLLENLALAYVSAGEMAVLLSTEPFWAAAFSAALLGETMGSQAIAGGGVILAACLLNQLKDVNLQKMLRRKAGAFSTPFGSVLASVGMLFNHGVERTP